MFYDQKKFISVEAVFLPWPLIKSLRLKPYNPFFGTALNLYRNLSLWGTFFNPQSTIKTVVQIE